MIPQQAEVHHPLAVMRAQEPPWVSLDSEKILHDSASRRSCHFFGAFFFTPKGRPKGVLGWGGSGDWVQILVFLVS